MSKQLQQWIADLDNGKRVKSVSMGGLGKGYELAIQNLAVEMIRNLADENVPEDKEEFRKIAVGARDKAIKKLGEIHGFSGAQVGAAGNIGSIFWERSPDSGIKEMEERDPSRIIELWIDVNGNLDCTIPEEE